MNELQDNNMEMCELINRFVNLLAKGNIYNFDYDQQEYFLDNNINANYLLSFDEWNDKGARILKGSKAIRLPHNVLVFDVLQTNYKLEGDEVFPRLIVDIDSGVGQRNINAVIDSFISSNPYSDDHIQYNDVIYGILLKRFKGIDYHAESHLIYPDKVDLELVSEINNKLFNLIKSLYNDVKWSGNEFISLNELLEYAIENEIGGEYYGFRSDNDNEAENGLSQRESAMDLSASERQRNSISASERNRTDIYRQLDVSGGGYDEGLQSDTREETSRTSVGGIISSERTIQQDSQRDGTSGNTVQESGRIETESDVNVAFSNYQDFAIHMHRFGYIKISEGTGDNLLKEDRDEGYVDYINYTIYDSLEDMYDDIERDGGMFLLDDYYTSKFNSVDDVVKHLINADELPDYDYEIINDSLDNEQSYINEQLSLFDSIQAINIAEFNNELNQSIVDELDNKEDIIYKESNNRLTESTSSIQTVNNDYLVYDNNATDMWEGIFDIASPQQTANDFGRTVIDKDGNIYPYVGNKTFDDLNDDERRAVENDDELYLTVYNNTVDKGFEFDDEMKNFMDSHMYGSQDGITDPNEIKVLAKWFSPIGAGTWIATECDGYDENGNPYLYGCCTLGYGWEWGTLPTIDEMKSLDLGAQFGHLRIEKDNSVNVGDSLYEVLRTTDLSALDDLNLDSQFYTDDQEIERELLRGSGFEHGKFRIYELFTNQDTNLSSKEIANLLKKEYGTGGRSGPRSSNSRIKSSMHDSKGIRISLYNSNISNDTHDVNLSWSDVYNRTKALIDERRYLSNEEYIEYQKWIEDNKDTLLSDDSVEDDDTYDGINVEINPIVFEYAQPYQSEEWKKAHPLHLTNLQTGETEIVDEFDDRISNQLTEGEVNLKSIVVDLTGNSDNHENIDVKYNPMPVNYKIDDLDIGVGQPLERFNNNIEAIKLLRTLESEDRNASSDEQSILAKYVGWGGLSDFFDDSKRPEQHKQIKELLSDTEYNSARESTLSAFYTQPVVIDAIYQALDKFGFKKGNILEPSCGVGNFFGRLPDKMSDSNLYGVELDEISSRIAKKLYPNANIQTKGYENTTFDDNFFDIAIGNVPFGDFSVMDKRYDKYNLKIHDYFFAKTIDKVKAGGVIAFITSKGTMDKLNSKAREYIAERCDLIGSIRLPKEAFKSAAGTETVSDIIFLSKRETPRVNSPEWVKSSDMNFINVEYFDKYMSKDELEQEITNMLLNKDFEAYNKLSDYCSLIAREMDTFFYSNTVDPLTYEETPYSSRRAYTREYVKDRWNSIWSNRYGTIRSNSSFSFYSAGAIELYRWFKEDPEEVTRIVAESGKFNSKAKTNDEKYDMAYEYLTLSEDSIEDTFKRAYVNDVVNKIIEYAQFKDQKQGQYMQPINTYYSNNKDMIIGNPTIETSRFGYDLSVSIDSASDLSEELTRCIDKLDYEYVESVDNAISTETKKSKAEIVPANMNIRNYSYGILNDKIYYRTNSTMELIPSDSTNYQLLKDTIELNTTYKNLISAQLDGVDDESLATYQKALNDAYDKYVDTHGRIFTLQKKLKTFVSNDPTLDRISALENYSADSKKFVGKADIFTQRTIHSQENIVEHCETSLDALLVSLRSRLSVDLDLMSSLTDKTKDELVSDLKGAIFRNHLNEDEYLPADEYLSGNVKQKYKDVSELRTKTLKQLDKEENLDNKKVLEEKAQWLTDNLTALREAQPIDLQPFEIDMPLGASWIPERIIQRFTEEVILEGNFYSWNRPNILRSDISKNWYIENKTRVYDSANLNEKYGLNVKGHNALDILESCLNLKREEVAFYVEDENGKKVRVVDKQKTLIAIQKQDLIKKEFSNWIKENEDIANDLAEIYNDRFNCIVDRKYNPDLIEPVGLSNMINGKPIELYSHQKEAIAKALYGGNTGIFHSVGAGKTLTLITIAMESKRLGLCNKSLFVVPKSIVGQWGKDFLSAYPNANILVADEKSFTKENRRKFINKISSGNYDAIIISNEQFKLLKLSDERVVSYIQEDIDKIQNFLAEQRYRGGKKEWSVKQAESIKKKLEQRIKKRNEMTKDDFINFEELGIDKLFIDESHNFKNLAFETSLGRIKGIGSSADAQKSNDLYYKTRYLNQLTNNKGIVFATGTPISNYLAEMFTIQRYLQPDALSYMDVDNFDSWVSVFGEIVEEQQLDITGTKYVPRAVLKRYHNLPELMSAFRQVADIRTKDTLDLKLPEVERINIEVPRTDEQKDYLDKINERLDRIRNNQVDPTEDNMLLITNDGRKMALDQRLVDQPIQDDEKVKADYVVDNVYNEYMLSNDTKGTQAIFSDLSTPSDKWNVYDEIKKGLIAKGIPENEIQFIHDYEKQKDKDKLFSLINEGKVRVILGSTQKLGTGVNMQEKMVALHHIDVPWKPSDIEQREGRAIRQGNTNDKVKVYRYITADTFDAYSWQIIENKATFISQIMTNKNPARTCDDLDEVILDAAEIKAIATGNPLVKERMTLENDIKKLTISKQEYLKGQSRLKENITINIPNDIAYRKDNISRLENDISLYTKPSVILTDDGKEQYKLDITVNNKHFTDYKLAGEELHNMTKIVKWPDDKLTLSYKGKLIGKYQNFDIRIAAGENVGDFVYVIGDKWYNTVTKYESPINMTKYLIAKLDSLQDILVSQKEQLENALKNLESSKKLLNQPFEYDNELRSKQERLNEIIESMDSAASYSSDESLDGQILYDENGVLIDNDYSNEYDEETEKCKEL